MTLKELVDELTDVDAFPYDYDRCDFCGNRRCFGECQSELDYGSDAEEEWYNQSELEELYGDS